MEPNPTLSRRVKACRKMRGLGQVELAKKAGLSQPTIATLELGIRGANIDTLIRICKALNVSADYLLGLVPPTKGLPI